MNDTLFHFSQFILFSMAYDIALNCTSALLKRYSPKFKVLSTDRQKYVVTNINKSVLLSFLAGIFLKTVYYKPLLLQNNFPPGPSASTTWKTLTVLYSCTDFVALIRDKTMSKTTKIHHYAVLVSLIVVLFSKFYKGSLAKAIVIYGGFSSLAFMVNLYLGARFLFKRESVGIKFIKKLSLYTYAAACGLNWVWQSNYILHAYSDILSNPTMLMKLGLNLTMLYSWIRDDTILIRHLNK